MTAHQIFLKSFAFFAASGVNAGSSKVRMGNCINTFKRPESVLVLVYTEAGEVLMLRRRQPDDFWQSVTGSLEQGETPEQAARRELFEETGLAVNAGLIDCNIINRFPILPAWRTRYAPEVSHNTEYVFRLALPQRAEVCIDSAEHLEYQWLDCRSAVALASSHTNRAAILAWVMS